MEREKLGSRLGFILLSAGCAIGCGNVWKFPWMCGQYGGGGFVLLYVLCLVVLGLPIMTMEFCVGRAAQTSPIHMYQKLEKKGQKWHIHGYVSLFGSIALMAFYTVVTGWIVYYFVQFLTGNSQNLGFSAMIADPGVNVTYLAVTVAMAFGVLCFGLQSGLERVTKYMMLLLLLLMLVLAVHSFTLDGAAEGLRFYLVPDLSRITGSVVVGAMNQAFFTLSVGMGAMAIFGSYIDKHRASYHGAFSADVVDLHEDYIRPQENGSHADCNKAVLSGGGLSLAAVGPTPFSFNASRYTQEELAARRRNTDLTPSGSTVLCLDAAMAGIGSNSCGPALRPRYRVDSQELGMELHLLLNPLITHASTHNEVTL